MSELQIYMVKLIALTLFISSELCSHTLLYISGTFWLQVVSEKYFQIAKPFFSPCHSSLFAFYQHAVRADNT